MSKHITDDQMRSLWKRRCQARKAMGKNAKVIHEYTADERAELERCEREIDETSAALTQGLRDRGGLFWMADDFPIVLDSHGDMAPLWMLSRRLWPKADPSFVNHGSRLLDAAMRRIEKGEAVA